MTRQPHYFTVHLEEGVIGRAWVNDLPVHKVLTTGPDSMSGGVNHLLVPGKNEFVLEILKLPPPMHITPVGMKIYTIVDPDAKPLVANLLAGVDLPVGLGLKAGETPQLPIYHRVEFEVPAELAEPPYFRAPRSETPCSGTPELLRVVEELQEALESRDPRRFLDLISLKHEWFAAAFAGDPFALPDRQREGATDFFATNYVVRPLDKARLHFETRSAGRVVYVSAWDDGPVLEAVSPPAGEDQPTLALRTNLLLTQVNGQWRVFA